MKFPKISAENQIIDSQKKFKKKSCISDNKLLNNTQCLAIISTFLSCRGRGGGGLMDITTQSLKVINNKEI